MTDQHGVQLHPTVRTNLLYLTDTYNGGRPVGLSYDQMEHTNYAEVTALNIMISEETLLIHPTHFVHVAHEIVQGHQRRLARLNMPLDELPSQLPFQEFLDRHMPPPDMDISQVPFQEILDRLFDEAADSLHPPERPVPPTAGAYGRWRKNDAKAGLIGSMCTICQEDFRSNQKIRVMHEKCTYHEKCINKWFEYKSTCPNCKRGF